MSIKAAVFSTDPALLEQVLRVAEDVGDIRVAMRVDAPYTDLEARHLDQIELLNPEVVFLDLEGQTSIGLKFAQFLVESNPGRKLIGAGPELSNDVLLSAMQAGVSEYLTKPGDDAAMAEALGRVTRKLGKKAVAESREPGRVLTFFGAKGGTGSTTLATSLAVEIHRITRKRVLLVDLDFELGETALMLGIEPEFSMVDLVRNYHRVDSDLLASYIDRHESGLDVLAAPYEPADIEAVDGAQIRQILDFLRQSYDFVVVDAPKSFGPATQAALEVADELFVVTTPDLPSLRNLTRCLSLVRALRRHVPEDPIRLVVNRADTRELITPTEVEKTLGLDVYATVANDYRAVMNAINSGKPGVDDSRTTFARNLRSLAGLVTGVDVSVRPTGIKAFLPFGRKTIGWRNGSSDKAVTHG